MPLDQRRLEELALTYVARFATSSGKLTAYLARKLRERGWAEDAGPPPDLAALAARYAEIGYLDDAAYARSKGEGLLRRGYGARRVDQALIGAGIGETLRAEVTPDEAARRSAVVALARRRRFGPFGPFGELANDPARRDKQLAAMLRAGHGFADARHVLDAPSAEALDEWMGEGAEDGPQRGEWD